MDAAVVHATETPVYRYGISFNKLFEYMAAAIPVVFACSSAYDPVATIGRRPVASGPTTPEGLAEAFLELAGRTPAERAEMGADGRAYAAASTTCHARAGARRDPLASGPARSGSGAPTALGR